MEKFGIFELLDTLSALIASGGADGDGAEPLPPDAGSPPADAPERKRENANAALSSFLARHDAAARRLGGKK